jgi:hypothetical protein
MLFLATNYKMGTTLSSEQILEVLQGGRLDQLIGLVEDSQLEAKGQPYFLQSGSGVNTQQNPMPIEVQKRELAKDVSSLANSAGGIILLGCETSRDSLTAQDKISSCRPFERGLVDLDQYRKVLEDWITPPIHSIQIDWYQSFSDPTKGIVAIWVPATTVADKPYIVKRVVESDGKVRGTLIGYYERVRDRTPETSAERLRTWLRDGMRFEEILSQRFEVLEKLINGLLKNSLSAFTAEAAPYTCLSDEEIEQRRREAREAVDRATKPSVILTAVSGGKTSFQQLFESRSEPVVQFFENAPMRKEGFAIWNALDKRSDMIRARLRRRLNRGVQILDLWQDGLLIGIGEGDYDLLCWWTRYPYSKSIEEQSLIIRNFVLAEVTIMFLRFAVELFKYAEPPPKELRFGISLENMTVNGLPCELSNIRDREGNPVPPNTYRTAPGAHIYAEHSASFADIDTGRVAYELLGNLYVQFGFHKGEMPYVEKTGERNRITLETLQISPAQIS